MENNQMKPDPTLQSILAHIGEDRMPSQSINLWPALRSRLSVEWQSFPSQSTSNNIRNQKRNIAAIVSFITIVIFAAFLITPQGRVWAQEFLQFFTRARTDTLPVQLWQLNPQPTLSPGSALPDPASILEAKLSVYEVKELSGYEVKEPFWLPEHLTLVGATYDAARSLVRIFYRLEESNGLILKEEFYSSPETCALCNEVGSSANVETVQIENATGEYVQGVWKLTENGPVWENDPYLQTLRWQADGIAYELQFMGPPESLKKEDLVNIASSLR